MMAPVMAPCKHAEAPPFTPDFLRAGRTRIQGSRNIPAIMSPHLLDAQLGSEPARMPDAAVWLNRAALPVQGVGAH